MDSKELQKEGIDELESQDLSTEETGDELYEHFHVVVDKGQSLLRIDKYLAACMSNTSRNRVRQASAAGNILVNGKTVKQNYRVKPYDEISVVLSFPPREIEIIPENIPLNIVYEDDDVMIINKEAGMVVHPAYGNYTGTLVNAVSYHLLGTKAEVEDLKDNPFLVHRIDKNTSGIMVVAKNRLAQSKMALQFFNHTITRRYVALVWGNFDEDKGTIEGNVGRCLKDRKIMDVFPDGSQGKHAVTHWKVLERFGYVTLVECRLETGRTHQIRVHMKHIGHPLFNDATYGGDRILKGTTFSKYKQFVQNCFNIMPRQALHAKCLGFVHPTTGQEVFFDSDIAPDMQAVIDRWRNYAIHKEYEEPVDVTYDLTNRERQSLQSNKK